MKSKWDSNLKLVNYMTTTQIYKALFAMIIILTLYASFGLTASAKGMIDALIIPFQFPIFNLFLFSLLLLNVFNTTSTFSEKFPFFIIRLKNRKQYVKQSLTLNFLSTILIFLLFFLLFFLFTNLIYGGKLMIHSYQNYMISNVIYLLFYLLRYIIASVLICSIFALLEINLKKRTVILIASLFLSGFLLENNSYFLPWAYLEAYPFDNFSMEVCCSLGFILVLEEILFLLYKWTIKRMGERG